MRLVLRQKQEAYTCDPQAQAELVSAPESGPGYQLLRFAGGEGPVGDYIAFNAEFLVPIAVVHDDLWGALTDWPSAETFDEYKALFPNAQTLPTLPAHVPIPGTGAAGSPRSTLIVKGAGPERFWRFSAFSPDRRITSSGAVVAGTYLVTDNDEQFIKTGQTPWQQFSSTPG